MRTFLLWLLAVLALAVLLVLGLTLGAQPIAAPEVFAAIFAPDRASPTALEIVRGLRLPRVILAVLVGIALGLSGALMQLLSRNPLADPGLLGLNAGAGLAVVLGAVLAGLVQPWAMTLLAFLGAAAAGVTVQLLAGSGRATPLRLTLAGVAVSAFLGGITAALILRDTELFRQVLGWGAGSLVVSDPAVIPALWPVVLAGFALTLWLASALDALEMGDDLARSLGVRLGLARNLALLALTALAGAATAAAGPIGFVGLVVPHVVRLVLGRGALSLLLGTALLGPVLMLAADLLARLALADGELPVGIVTAAIGAPLLIWLARRSTQG